MSYLDDPIEELQGLAGFRERAERCGLQEHTALLERIARTGIRFELERCELALLPEQSTYFGGDPDVPATFAWPTFNECPLTFIAQFDLAQLGELMSLPMPAAGLLSVFYEAVEQPWGFRPTDAGSCVIMWLPPGTATSRRRRPPYPGENDRTPPPYYNDVELNPCRAAPRVALTLPHVEHPLLIPILGERVTNWFSSSPEIDAYSALRHSLGCYGGTQLFGYPGEIQNPLEVESEYVSNGGLGFAEGNLSQDDVENPELVARAYEWELVLSVDSEETTLGVMWALSGAVYFLNRATATRERDFTRPWAIVHGT